MFCEMVPIPPRFENAFSSLEGVPIYFFNTAKRIKSQYLRNKRVCFVTDHTINVAHYNGDFSYACKVEDLESVLWNDNHVGFHIAEHPFRVKTSTMYHPMPVDLLLRFDNKEEGAQLVAVVSALYEEVTSKPIHIINRETDKTTKLHLILQKEGSRVDPVVLPFRSKEQGSKPPVTGTVVSPTSAAVEEKAIPPEPSPLLHEYPVKAPSDTIGVVAVVAEPPEAQSAVGADGRTALPSVSVRDSMEGYGSSTNPLSIGFHSPTVSRESSAFAGDPPHSPPLEDSHDAVLEGRAKAPRVLPALDQKELDKAPMGSSPPPGRLVFQHVKRHKG